MEEIKYKLTLANKAYRNGVPYLTDQEYDVLLSKLKTQIPKDDFEKFVVTLTEESGKVKHNYIIGSLNKIKHGENELAPWVKKYKPKNLFCSYKLDGMSFVATYIDGILVELATRGDGFFGESMYTKAEYISIPKDILCTGVLEVRGELVLEDDSHIKLGFKNRRNGVVGIMKEDKIDPIKLSHVKAYAYQILNTKDTLTEQYTALGHYGFICPPVEFIVDMNDIDGIESYLKKMSETKMPFDFDGIVINDPDFTNENVFYPERMVAYKVNSEGVPCRVTGITWEVSKNCLLKPVIQIEPTDIDGSTITNVTGYNAQWILDKKIGVDGIVSVIKSGSVIPKVIDIIKENENILMPTTCPACSCTVSWSGVELKCDNDECFSATIKQVESFVKNSGIENVSEKRLSEWGIYTFDELLAWYPSNLKSQQTFYSELQKKVFEKDEITIMRNFSCNGFGQTQFDKMNEIYPDIEKLNNIMTDEGVTCMLPVGIGVLTLMNAREDWIRNYKILQKIKNDPRYNPAPKSFFDDIPEVIENQTLTIEDTFLFTGTLSKKRSEYESMIKSKGGTILSSVTKNLKYLVCGMDSWNSSSKFKKAEKLGIDILTEEQLLNLI